MRAAMILKWTAMAAFLAVMASCSSSTSPTAGGGSDLPNGSLAAVFGTVTLPDSSPAAQAEISLREVLLTSTVDTVVSEYTVSTSSGGQFAMPSVPAGRYVLVTSFPGTELAAVDFFVEVRDSSDIVVPTLRLLPRVDLVGFLSLPVGYAYEEASVRIPGTDVVAEVGLNRMYVLEDAPQGEYDITYQYDGIANYMRVAVRAGEHPDTLVHLRNTRFAALSVMGDTSHEFHRSEISVSYSVVPRVYPSGQEPSWYHWVDLSRVEYFGWHGDTLVSWVPESACCEPMEFDTVLFGTMYRDTVSGKVLLESPGGGVLTLRGGMLGSVGPESVPVTIAARIRHDAGQLFLEVVDLHYEPQPPPDDGEMGMVKGVFTAPHGASP